MTRQISARQKLAFLCLGFFALILSSCATKEAAPTRNGLKDNPVASPILEKVSSQPMYWWEAKFKMFWPEQENPNLVYDLIVAHQILRPVLLDYSESLLLWRFHRRAVRDQSGHQFSLLFYSSKDLAAQIKESIASCTALEMLQTVEVVESFTLSTSGTNRNSGLHSSSDPNWPKIVQRAWPDFIMGASATWLRLIHETASKSPLTTPWSKSKLLKHYSDVDKKIERIWFSGAQHIFLHHLSALFGYKPMAIRKSIQF